MINVILIDDEEPALSEMEYMLRAYPFVNIVGMFLNPIEAFEKVEVLKPHAVFIDINMPQLSGITLTKKLKESLSNISVVFVTAYEQYAIEAFRVEALDYLLKPVSRELLDHTIARLSKKHGVNSELRKNRLELISMGGLRLCWSDGTPIKWRTEKEKELFAFLLNYNGVELSKDRIINELWSDYEVTRAVSFLHNSIYRLKRALREYGINAEQINISGHYCLNLGDVWYDRAFIESTIKNPVNLQTTEELEAVLKLFGDGYLQIEGWAWAEQDREILRQSELDIRIELSKKYIQAGKPSKAERMLKEAFSKNPFEEKVTYMLLELYKKTGETVKAAKHYAEYQKILRDELKINPGENIEKIYDSIFAVQPKQARTM